MKVAVISYADSVGSYNFYSQIFYYDPEYIYGDPSVVPK